MSQTLFMETTQVGVEKTLGEITILLVQHKATSIMTEYKDGKVSSLCFRIPVNGALIPFVLPCRWESIQTTLASRSRSYKQAWNEKTRLEALKPFEDQARRVAWRQILRWVQAQLALVATGMVKVEEVFLPYVQTASGETIFELSQSRGLLQLTNTHEP